MPTHNLAAALLPFITQKARYKTTKGGRGSGKSWGFAEMFLAIGKMRKIRVLCTRETMKSIEESVFQLLLDTIERMGLGWFYDHTKNKITGRNGTEFIFAGLRTIDISKLKSIESIDYCWVEEGQVLSEKSWRVLTPTIRKKDSEIWTSFNPELDTDPTYERLVENPHPDSILVTMNWRDNPWFPEVLNEERRNDRKRDKTKGQMVYQNVWEGKTMPAVEGAIFADEVATLFEQGRVRPTTYDTRGKVHVIMDLGYGVMAAILVQRFASSVQVIGYKELTHSTYHDLTVELEKLPYRWGKVWMPHDATHKDPKIGKSHFKVMRELGWDCHKETTQIPQIGIENYVSAGRDLFGNVYVDDGDDCKQLIHCLRRWKRHIPTTTDSATNPMKDEFSHGSEAWCYLGVVADMLDNDVVDTTDPYAGFRGVYAG